MASIEKIRLSAKYKGLESFVMDNLRNEIILTGPNGSGKTRLLKLLADYLKNKDSCECKDFLIYPDRAELEYKVSDFSHYDAPLQLPSAFPYFVVAKTAYRLKAAEFANIDKEALLYIQCIAQHNKSEFEQFNNLLEKIIGERIHDDNGKLTFFSLAFKDMNLSPGQQYLLRLCVALFCNRQDNFTPDKYRRVLLLDEPEMHLHPGVLLNVMHKIQEVFTETQIWIATHSITLLSMFDSVDIWYMNNGKPKRMGSNSYDVLQGLLTDKTQKTDYRAKLEYFIQLPDFFAICEFAKESLKEAESLSLKERIDGEPDPQNTLAKQVMNNEFDFDTPNTLNKKKLVDFGAGKGRFIEGFSNKDIDTFEYYAYNIINDLNHDDKTRCLDIMASRFGDDRVNEKYFENITELHNRLANQIDYVLLMNVLHEIDPCEWENTLKKEILPLLSDKGKLIIIEAEELTHGENASSCGFLILTEEASKKLFGSVTINRPKDKKDKKTKIIAYIVGPKEIGNICKENIKDAVNTIYDEAIDKIKKTREKQTANSEENPHQKGIRHAFWLHQYANASIARDSLSKEKP